MKVYLVTKGSYSDFHVCCVCSTPEIAKRACELYSDSYDNAFDEEVELDDFPNAPTGMMPWSVCMDRNGHAHRIKRESTESFRDCSWAPYGDDHLVAFRMFAVDEVHAVKIANEKRAGLIASGEWTTDWKAWANKRRTVTE